MMRFALVTTTIHVPEVLRLYRELGPDVPFFIAGDVTSPHAEIEALGAELGNCTYLGPEAQEERYERLSDAIGWRSIQRRNIAVLEAAQTDAEVIVSIDDDNAPVGDYFAELEASLSSHPKYLAEGPWFNLGDLCAHSYRYRGFPFSQEPVAHFSPNGSVRPTGVVNGAIYGDPDINATERLERNPEARIYQPVVAEGIALDPKTTWSPINSQNTAWRRELAPLMLLLPALGRYDDIWGSYIAQRVMQASGYHVLFGRPYVRQERNEHDIFRDLEDELHGMRHTAQFCAALREMAWEEGDLLTDLDEVTKRCVLPVKASEFCEEWVKAWRALE